MNTRSKPKKRRGIALIMVLLVIAVLAVLAGNFAATMKVETMLARNTSLDSDYEWLARGGVNGAQWILSQETAQFTGLNQCWAGGDCSSNAVLALYTLEHFPIGDSGDFVKIVMEDQERFFNVNLLRRFIDGARSLSPNVSPNVAPNLPPTPSPNPLEGRQRAAHILDNALGSVIGVDAGQVITIRDSIIDWMDMDENSEASGAETSDYKSHPWLRHIAKDGPFDDLSEMLLVKGITEQPQIYSRVYASPGASVITKNNRLGASKFEQVSYDTTLVDLFTTLSAGQININTASSKVLQVIPEISEQMADAIVAGRAGPDPNTTEDDGYRSLTEPSQRPQSAGIIPPGFLETLAPYLTVQSFYFRVHVTVTLAGGPRTYHAILQRRTPRDIQLMAMDWD
jgi:type II secretory pathway component PulK